MFNPYSRTVVPMGDISRYAMGDIVEVGAEGAALVTVDPTRPTVVMPGNMGRPPETVVSAIKQQNVPFISVENGHVQSSPFGGQAFFQYAELEANINEIMAKTPAEPVVKSTPEAGGTAATTISLADVIIPSGNTTLSALWYPFFVIQFSAPQLNQLPAGVISLVINMASEFRAAVNLVNLQIAVTQVTQRVAITIVPAFIIQAKPRPLIGRIDGTPKNIVVTSSGLATGTVQTLIVPGSTHQSINSMLAMGR